MRPKIGLGTGWGHGAIGGAGAAVLPVTPGELRATKFINAQAFHGGSIPRTITAEKFVNEQVFYSLATLAAPVMSIGDGALQSAAVAPINAGLVFCLGSHPTGSALLGKDLVSGNAGTLLASGNLAGTNLSHGTWRCLESTSSTDGGVHFPSTSPLRSITTQRTFAFHGVVDAFGDWASLISIPYAVGTWVQPWMAHSLRRQLATSNLNTHAATGGTNYTSVNSAGGFTTGERWFAVAIDGAAGIARFYVDGFQVGGDVGISTAPVDWSTAQPIVIFNRSNSSTGLGVDGRCYTAAIWNRVLSAAEILSLFDFPQQMFASGGPVSLIATKFINAQTFGLHTLVGAGTIQLTATKFVETQVFRSHIITQAPPPGSGTVGPLEPVDGSALGRTITVETSPRQTWIGYGWGTTSPNMAHWTGANAANLTKLCEDMGATVVRYHTPETGATFVNEHLAHWNLISAHGIDTIFFSCYVYRTANAPQQAAGSLSVPSNVPNITGARNGVNTVLASINPSNGVYVNLQNEPDGNQYNHPTVGGVGNATQAQIRGHYQTFNSGLNASAKVLGLEWRHPETMMGEFDDFNANDLFSDGIVQGQCYHIYNKGATDQYYDQRLKTVGPQPGGLDLFSTETGDNGNASEGNLSSPYTAARFISGVNNGGRVEIHHLAIAGVDGDGKVQCLIDSTTNTVRNWYAASKIISKHLIRGTVMRLCRSNDRPTIPNMPDNQASRMIIDARTCGCQPRHFVACGERTDGRWVLVANNHAYDTKVETPFAGGHYGAPSGPGPNQQLTVTIPELASFDQVWSGQRATRTGSTTNVTVNMRAGIMRFTLAPAETLAITMDTAIIPANALDRSAYASTAAWINDMNAQGKPGKVGSGTYTFTQRQILTQSIYGYGVTKPIFKGPGTSNTTRALSFLYIHAPNVRVTNVAFEDINMPFISCDDTVNDDWGNQLIPMSGYGWNSAEYGLASHYYNQDLVNLQVDHCNFTNCGVCVMLVRHGNPDIAPIASRIHDGFKFTDNVVRNGMSCVSLLGYQFRNFELSRNDVRNMVGSSFGGASANHTDTIFMIGGINNNFPELDYIMGTNSVTISDNVVIGFVSTHGQNNKNGAVYFDCRHGGNILSERNHVENCYSTGGTQDCNAVYLKSRGNIRFNNNLYRNCGSRPVDSGSNHGSESQFYTFKGDTTDVISTDDVFETGPQCGNAPWIQAGTATDFTMIRPTFRGWRNDGTWWGRPGVPCMIHHWNGDRFVTVDAVLENCGWSGTQAYAVVHRDRAGGVCSHTGMRADFQSNATAIIGQGSGGATISLIDCQNTTGQNLTLVTGLP